MTDELTNLLPRERRRAISRDYLLRLGVVLVWAAAALVLVAMILLVPTYVFLSETARTKEAHLASIESTLATGDGASFSERLATLSGRVSSIAALANAPSASEILRAVLAVSRPGISLTGFAYAPAAGTKLGTLAVSGTAATRDALRSYQLALSSAPFSTAANLPVSSYAKESDIAFTITVTLAPALTARVP